MIDWFQCVSTTCAIINHSRFDMRFKCISFIMACICGYITANRAQDAFVGQYIDLVNVYFKHKQVSILSEFTCFSIGKTKILLLCSFKDILYKFMLTYLCFGQ